MPGDRDAANRLGALRLLAEPRSLTRGQQDEERLVSGDRGVAVDALRVQDLFRAEPDRLSQCRGHMLTGYAVPGPNA